MATPASWPTLRDRMLRSWCDRSANTTKRWRPRSRACCKPAACRWAKRDGRPGRTWSGRSGRSPRRGANTRSLAAAPVDDASRVVAASTTRDASSTRKDQPMTRMLAVVIAFVAIAAVQAEEPIFAPGAALKVDAANGAGGEGPAWHPKLGVLSSGNGHVNRLTRDGQSRVHRKDAGTNGLLFDAQGRLVACESERRRVTRTEADGTVTVLTERYGGKRYNTPNDLTLDAKGRIYFSDPRYGDRTSMEI